MVISCDGRAVDVLQRLERMAADSRDQRFPYASDPHGLSGYRLRQTAVGTYELTLSLPGRHVYSCTTTITVAEDVAGTTLRFASRLTPGFFAATAWVAALPIALTFLTSMGEPFKVQPYLMFVVGAALFAGLFALFGTGMVEARTPEIATLLRHAAHPDEPA